MAETVQANGVAHAQRWRVVGASARGADHERNSEPNQDAFAVIRAQAGIVIIVADGAGSARHAKEAAQAVVSTIGETVADWPSANSRPISAQQLKAALEQARAGLAERAMVAGCSIADFACTAILVVLGEDWVVTAHVGDGAVVIAGEGGALTTLSPPEPSEHINETSFLSMVNGVERARYRTHHGPVEAAAVFSDGLMLRILSYPRWEPHRPFFEPFVETISAYTTDEEAAMALSAFLASDSVRASSGDDLTLVVATRRSAQ